MQQPYVVALCSMVVCEVLIINSNTMINQGISIKVVQVENYVEFCISVFPTNFHNFLEFLQKNTKNNFNVNLCRIQSKKQFYIKRYIPHNSTK